MNSRRSFLQILGISPMAAPLAAKAMADKTMAELTGIASTNFSGMPAGGIAGAIADESPGTWKKKVMRFLAEKALPDWFDDEIRSRNRFVGFLDPDIASKRSWSMAVKICTQRERNIKRARLEVFEGTKRGLRQREFEEKFGVWL